jgi:hypothetical protein
MALHRKQKTLEARVSALESVIFGTKEMDTYTVIYILISIFSIMSIVHCDDSTNEFTYININIKLYEMKCGELDKSAITVLNLESDNGLYLIDLYYTYGPPAGAYIAVCIYYQFLMMKFLFF